MGRFSFVIASSVLGVGCYHPEPYQRPPDAVTTREQIAIEPLPARVEPPARLPPPKPPKPAWPAKPAQLPTLEESAAAMPAWWKKQSDGTSVPSTPVAHSLWERSHDFELGAVAGGLVCQLNSKVASADEHEVSKVRVEGSGTATVVSDGDVVFLPGMGATGVRRIEAHHGRVHRMGVVDWIVGVAVIPLLPLMLNSEGYRPDGYVTGRVTGPPWKLSSKALEVECRPVARDDLEPLVADVLTRSEQCLTRNPNSELPTDPEPACASPVAGLLGWADPRTQAVMARIAAEAELAKADRLKTHQRDLERAQTDFGDLDVTRSTLTCPTKGDCTIELTAVNRSIAARSWFSHPWHTKRTVIDAKGDEFEVYLEAPRDRIATGAKIVFSSALEPVGAATRPEAPLTLRLASTQITAVPPESISCEVKADGAQLSYLGPATTTLKFESLIEIATGDDRLGKAFDSDKYIVDLYGAKKCPTIARIEQGKDRVLRIPSE